MPLSPLSQSISDYPPDLIRMAVVDANRDADRVDRFLGSLLEQICGSSSEARSLAWPTSFLLDLAAALRLLCLEHQGISLHRKVGLPSAQQAFCEVFRRLHPKAGDQPACPSDPWLMPHVFALAVQNMAWNGHADLQADCILGTIDEDELVDTLAQFIWNHRHARNPDTTQEN